MLFLLFASLVVLVLPGAAIFALPVADPERRAQLRFEERVFWWIVVSVALSLSVTLALAAAGVYAFGRLLIVNAIVSAAAAVAIWRARRGAMTFIGARRPTTSALVPAALVGLGLWLYFPTAEYVIGGKDPGTYMNEGIQIAQRGRLIVKDQVAASVPGPVTELFFPSQNTTTHHSVRFMGFSLLDAHDGSVVGQFPHLFPASIALGYGINGLSGARDAVAGWAMLGLLAVYFAGARLAGRAAATAAAALLAINIVSVWFARYPNSEVVLQALAFAALLAFARSFIDGDRFFAPIAAVLLALLVFIGVYWVLLAASIGVAIALGVSQGRRMPVTFVIGLSAGVALAGLYLWIFVKPYLTYPIGFVHNLRWIHVAAIGAGSIGLFVIMRLARRPAVAHAVRRWVPILLAALVSVAAVYALYLRQPGGRLAAHDAAALRTYAAFYVTVPAIAAAVLGFVILCVSRFWKDPALFVTGATFAFFFFYKLRIVTDHFWAARRFLPIILPLTMLFASAAALAPAGAGWRESLRQRRLVALRPLIGVALLAMLGAHYWRAMQPVRHHVEYAGVIPKLETLAKTFGDEDLVLVESSGAGSDLHTLALPLAYIYARNVLVLNSRIPDRAQLVDFLSWAQSKYREVYFLGGGGTDLLSRSVSVEPVTSDRFQVPEYESLRDAYPRGVRHKEWDYGVYRFVTPRAGGPGWFSLDLGAQDDLLVVRFHAKERNNNYSFRWSKELSYITVLGMRPDWRTVTIWMGDARPEKMDAAEPALYFNDWKLGQTRVSGPIRPYTFSIPPDVAAAASAGEAPPKIRLITNTWNPRIALGVSDDRELGVMVDRVEVR